MCQAPRRSAADTRQARRVRIHGPGGLTQPVAAGPLSTPQPCPHRVARSTAAQALGATAPPPGPAVCGQAPEGHAKDPGLGLRSCHHGRSDVFRRRPPGSAALGSPRSGHRLGLSPGPVPTVPADTVLPAKWRGRGSGAHCSVHPRRSGARTREYRCTCVLSTQVLVKTGTCSAG